MTRAKGSRPTATENKQFRDFVESARAVECDESEERFDAALRKVAAHKPSPKHVKEAKGKKPKSAK